MKAAESSSTKKAHGSRSPDRRQRLLERAHCRVGFIPCLQLRLQRRDLAQHIGGLLSGGRARQASVQDRRRHTAEWKAQVALREDTDRGRPRRAEVRGDRDKGLVIAGEKQTVAAYLRGWLEIVKPTVKESAWIRFEQLLRVHEIPGIGRIPLARLTPQQVQHLYADRLATGRSPTTINYLHGVLHHALEDAVRMNLVPCNVSALTKPPHVAKHEMQVYSPEQVDTLLTTAKGHRLEAMFALAVSTGMREGEIIALRCAGLTWT